MKPTSFLIESKEIRDALSIITPISPRAILDISSSGVELTAMDISQVVAARAFVPAQVFNSYDLQEPYRGVIDARKLHALLSIIPYHTQCEITVSGEYLKGSALNYEFALRNMFPDGDCGLRISDAVRNMAYGVVVSTQGQDLLRSIWSALGFSAPVLLRLVEGNLEVVYGKDEQERHVPVSQITCSGKDAKLPLNVALSSKYVSCILGNLFAAENVTMKLGDGKPVRFEFEIGYVQGWYIIAPIIC